MEWGLQGSKPTSALAHSVQFSPPRRTPQLRWILMLWCSQSNPALQDTMLTLGILPSVEKRCGRPPSGTHWGERQQSSQVSSRKPNVSTCQFCVFEETLWGRLLLDNVPHARDKLWIFPAFRSSWRKELKDALNQLNSSQFRDTNNLCAKKITPKGQRLPKQSVCVCVCSKCVWLKWTLR